LLRLRVLGAVDLRDGDGRELRTLLAQPKRVALLAYLAFATPRGAHRRDKLLALFWPDHDTEHARNALSQAVHFLRRTLGANALISRNSEEVAIEPSEVWCDAVAFEEALDAGRLNDAVELHRGDLLEAFHFTDTAPEFERWVDMERKRLAQRYGGAVEQLAIERDGATDFEGAVRWWRRLAAREPYSSRVTLRLMRALAAAGDPAAALQHARVHEKLLRDDLEAPLHPEITALVEQLKSSPPGPSHPARPLARPPAIPPPVDPRPLRSRRRMLATAGLVALIVVGAVTVRKEITAAAHPPIRSLAVLPLDNLSADSAQQPFADGMHDVLITELARYPELSVISRTSVLRYKGTKQPLPDIARELGVDGVVEGAVLREGGRVRMTAQLVHGPSDRHVWADRYERDVRDVLMLQAELAEAIAREVRVASSPLPRRVRSAAGPADSLPQELYLRELYLRGRHAELSRSLVGIQTAKEAYRRAIARDSTFALGYAGLAAVYGFEADYNYAPVGPALDSARRMARRAVELDSMLPETRTALAVTLGDAHQFEAAEREFKRAIALGPSNARAHFWYSILLTALGRGEEALREARRALELDPFSPRGALAMERYATWLVTGERPHFKLPVRERRPILRLEPGEPWARAREGVELAIDGKCDEGRVEIERAQRLAPSPNLRMLAHVGEFHWYCGERARARAILAQMKRHPDVRNHGFRLAWLYNRVGEKDSAFAWLDRHRWTMTELSNLSAGWALDSLRSDPRYLALMKRVGIR
jgi:TolB-like protein/DNA-binding SARP family transcriptional activator